MLSPYLKRIMIDALLLVAFGFGLFYAYKVFIDFLISLFHFEGTRNLSSIAYCVYRTLFIILPVIMLSMSKKISKMKVFKVIFMIMGICFLLGNSWIIYYMTDGTPINLLYGSVPKWFWNGELGEMASRAWDELCLYQYDNAIVFNYLIWDSYDLFNVIFSTIQGILYIQLSLILDTSRRRVMKKITQIFVLSFILPIIYNIICRKSFFASGTWLNKNILLMFESAFLLVSLNLAASSRSFWHDVLW